MGTNPSLKHWVMDVTNHDPERPVFYPVDIDSGTIVFGLAVVSPKCPGHLYGIVHEGGQDMANAWADANGDTISSFQKED